MNARPSTLLGLLLALVAPECGDAEGTDHAGETDPYLCTTSNAGLNLCTNYFGDATAEQRRQLDDQDICRFEPCTETRPEVCGQAQGMDRCWEVRALGRCEIPDGTAMGVESVAVTKTEQVFYGATALRGVVILYTREQAQENCAGLGGEWFDDYTPP